MSDPSKLSFEELVASLEGLTQRMASDSIGIEEAADLFEQAEKLHALALERMAAITERIERLTTRAEE